MSLSTLRSLGAVKLNLQASQRRLFSTSNNLTDKLRIGFVPEHFSTPLHYAYDRYGLDEHATLQSFESGTGTMIEAFHAKEIDVAIGLTDSLIVGLSKSTTAEKPYHMVGEYTLSPLKWAISTGALRADISYVEELKGLKTGISRHGSGSHIMAIVLAQSQGWLKGGDPFEFIVCGPMDSLCAAVNSGQADFFMWEHYTSKKFYDSGILKRIGEMDTPWNAWHIAAAGAKADQRVAKYLLPALEKGVKKFEDDKDDAVHFIARTMAYTAETAETWYPTVKFAGRKQLGSLNPDEISKTIGILKTAGVLGEREINSWKDLAASDAETYN